MTDSAFGPMDRSVVARGPTQTEWRKAVGEAKWSAYMAFDCGGSARSAHEQVLKLLERNPALKDSRFGKRYLAETSELGLLFDAQESVEAAIENTMAKAFGARSLKYW